MPARERENFNNLLKKCKCAAGATIGAKIRDVPVIALCHNCDDQRRTALHCGGNELSRSLDSLSPRHSAYLQAGSNRVRAPLLI
jgi:hypothetical protein